MLESTEQQVTVMMGELCMQGEAETAVNEVEVSS